MTDGTGESRQSVGSPAGDAADFRVVARCLWPAAAGRAIFADPSAVAAVVAALGSPESFCHRHRGVDRRRRAHVMRRVAAHTTALVCRISVRDGVAHETVKPVLKLLRTGCANVLRMMRKSAKVRRFIPELWKGPPEYKPRTVLD